MRVNKSADQVFDEMPHLERALEWLRPLIYGSYTWDYCVLWKLGDDPSRFIELVDCCCNGGEIKQKGIKKMKREQNVGIIPVCKDGFNVHPANTKACEALAKLPSSLPLYSGLHGEVVVSGQPKWLKIAMKSEPSTSQEDCIQTRVLIPVLGGLIELFSANNIPEDQRAVEIVRAQFAAFSETETMSTSSISFEGHPMMNPSLNQAGVLPLTQIPPVAHQHDFPNFDGSSTSSLPSDEHTSPDSNPCSVSQNPTLNPSGHCEKDDATERHKCKSKNYFTERRRRNRISEGMLTLRALVPKITKMNRAATLGDAINYIEELKNQVEELKFELSNMEEEDRCMIASGLKVPGSIEEVRERPNLGVQVVDGDQLSSGKLLLKMKCQQIPGAFTDLLEALGSSGVCIDDVTDANVTTWSGAMWSTFIIQTDGKDVQVQDLVRSLTSTTA